MSAAVLAAGDTAALVLFVIIGLLNHDHGVTAAGLARTALPLLGAWFIVSAVDGNYRRPGWRALIVTWAIAGFGMGLSYSTLSLVTLREAPPAEQGAATAGLQLSDVLGTSLGTGVGGALIALGARSGSPGWVGLAGAFVVAAVVAIAGLAITRRLGGSSRGRAVGVR